MIRKKGKSNGVPSSAADTGGEKAVEWEVRPGGMLVQKRSETDRESAPPAIIRVRVQFGSTSHQINISPQATFGMIIVILYTVLIAFRINIHEFCVTHRVNSF